MGMERLTSRPVVAVAAGCAPAFPRAQRGCVARADAGCVGGKGLLGMSASLYRGAGRAVAGALIGRLVFLDADSETPREIDRVRVGQCKVGAFNASQGSRGNFRGRRQLGLRQSSDNSPVSRVALVGRDGDDLFNRGIKNAHHSRQQVDLRSTTAGFPSMHSRPADVGEAAQVGDADTPLSAGRGEGQRIKSAQYSPRHRGQPAARFIVKKIHRGIPLPVNAGVILRCLSLDYGGTVSAMESRRQVADLLGICIQNRGWAPTPRPAGSTAANSRPLGG